MKRFFVLILVFVVLSVMASVFAGAIQTNQGAYKIIKHSKLTTDNHYDRNPSYFKASDGTWWLFFARSADGDSNYPIGCLGKGCDEGACDCDAAYYNVYYMTSSDSGTTWTEGGPIDTGIGQRDVAAFQASDGIIWVFTASGFGGSTDNKLRYYTFDGTTWTGPTILTEAGTSAGHVDAFQASSGRIWVVYEQSGPDTYVVYTDDNGATWSTPVQVNSGGIKAGVPKGMEAQDGTLIVVYTNNGNGIYMAKSTDGTTWTQSGPIADSSVYDYDPVVYQDSDGLYWLFWAPWDSSVGSQWAEYKISTNGKTWNGPIGFTAGGHGVNQWWDFWPEVGEGSDVLLFYTSEQNDTETGRVDGNIWMAKLQDRMTWLEEDDERKWTAIGNLESSIAALESSIAALVSDYNDINTIVTNIQNSIQMLKDQIKQIMDYISDIEAYLQSGYGPPPENYCGDGTCDSGAGETSSTCPEDCVDGGELGEIFITEGWTVTCPAIFNSHTIVQCRAEMLKGSWSLANYTLDVGDSKKVNWHAGYLLRLYGIPTGI
jgi:flagellin-like hook-associated protein FlgL